MPLGAGDLARHVARLGVMRLGATRLGYVQPILQLTINGTVRQARAAQDLVINDYLDGTPNTATLRVAGFRPVKGQEIKIGLGSLEAAQLIFAGHILKVTQVYVGSSANVQYDLACISYEWLLNRRLVTGRFTGASASEVVRWIMTHANHDVTGFSLAGVESALDTIDEISFTKVEVTSALDRVANRIGANWVVDYGKTLHFGTSLAVGSPIHAIDDDAVQGMEGLVFSEDLSQVRTRIVVGGGGAPALAQVAVGETILPVEDTSWYAATGGVVTAGPQDLTYTGLIEGGGGGLVGPGATPSAAPALALAAGSGVTSGAHDYAVTFTTAAGETLAGPLAAITTGTIAAPTIAPTPASLSSGGSVDSGVHDYAVTFVTATGETTPSPISSAITAGGAAASPPSSAPSAGTPTGGGSVTAGAHKYATTFVTASGETAAGPDSNTITTKAAVTAPGGFSSWVPTTGGSLDAGADYFHKITYVTAIGETTGQSGTGGSLGGSNTAVQLGLPTSADPDVIARRVYRTVGGAGSGTDYFLVATINDNSTTSYTDTVGDGSLGAAIPTSNTTARLTVALTGIQTGPSGTTARKVYRTTAGGSTLKLLTTISNNSTTTYSDTTADGSLGADAPTGATLNTVNLTGITVGNAAVTSRKVYRRSGGAGLKLLTTIADNSTTVYTDTTANASLGAAVPSANTATANQVSVSGIPIGAAGVTGRKVYRTAVGNPQLKLLTTISDNSTTTYTDSTADGNLGANAPASDTSGLAQPEGQVATGSTTIPVANTAAFRAAGGWAIVGNGRQAIRYTGISANTLTGIPASGAGAIVATVAYNSTITQAPALLGVPASGTGAVLHHSGRGADQPAGDAQRHRRAGRARGVRRRRRRRDPRGAPERSALVAE